MNLYMHSYISPISHFTLDYFFISRTHLNTEIVQISHNFHMDFMLLDSKRFEEFLFLTQHKYKSNYSGCWICVFSCYFFVRFSCSFTLTIARVVKGKLRESWRGESDEENKRKSKTSAQIFDIFFLSSVDESNSITFCVCFRIFFFFEKRMISLWGLAALEFSISNKMS